MCPRKVQDAYGQALFLVERSPRASGALSRYCLQQIIRDFWGLEAKNQGLLSDELDFISEMIAEETRDSIQCVRDFGSLDYHFSQDRDMMVDTTVEEARMLLALVQLLFQEWYAERYKRKTRYETIRRMAEIAQNTQEEAMRAEEIAEAQAADGEDEAPPASEEDTANASEEDSTKEKEPDNDDEPDAPKARSRSGDRKLTPNSGFGPARKGQLQVTSRKRYSASTFTSAWTSLLCSRT